MVATAAEAARATFATGGRKGYGPRSGGLSGRNNQPGLRPVGLLRVRSFEFFAAGGRCEDGQKTFPGGAPRFAGFVGSTVKRASKRAVGCGPMADTKRERAILTPARREQNWPKSEDEIANSMKNCGGEGGIRTHGTLSGTSVFETDRFNHSRTSPRGTVSVYQTAGVAT